MPQFRKKPVVIEAVQWRGDNPREVIALGGKAVAMGGPIKDTFVIDTLEGRMWALPGDWIIKGVEGELYPCKPGIFAATYDPVD